MRLDRFPAAPPELFYTFVQLAGRPARLRVAQAA